MKTLARIFLFLSLAFPTLAPANELPQFKEAPTRPSEEAEVVVEWQEILTECFEGKVCVQGQLYNQGKKTAKQVRLNIEIGGTKHTKPRIILKQKVEQSEMNPGDRQDFDLTIDRRISYKEKEQDKTIEVGKYNFKIVPTWLKTDLKKIPNKKPIKKRS